MAVWLSGQEPICEVGAPGLQKPSTGIQQGWTLAAVVPQHLQLTSFCFPCLDTLGVGGQCWGQNKSTAMAGGGVRGSRE